MNCLNYCNPYLLNIIEHSKNKKIKIYYYDPTLNTHFYIIDNKLKLLYKDCYKYCLDKK